MFPGVSQTPRICLSKAALSTSQPPLRKLEILGFSRSLGLLNLLALLPFHLRVVKVLPVDCSHWGYATCPLAKEVTHVEVYRRPSVP